MKPNKSAITVLLALASTTASAATFTVDTPNISTDADGLTTTLGDAIQSANASSSADVIEFDTAAMGTSTLSKSNCSTVTVNHPVTINGAGNITLQNSCEGDDLFTLGTASDVTLTLDGLTLTNADSTPGAFVIANNATGLGTQNLTIKNSTLKHESSAGNADQAAVVLRMANLTIEDSTFSGLKSGGFGSAIRILNSSADTATPSVPSVNISGSTFSGNSGTRGATLMYINNSKTVDINITNSTVSGNSSTSSLASLVFVNTSGSSQCTIDITHSTLVNNTSTGSSGAIHLFTGEGGPASVNLLNSVMSNNTSNGNNIDLSNSGTATFNASNSLIGNISNITLTTAVNIISSDPMLNDLADNGGSTLSHLPKDDSPVINAGQDTGSLPSTDQRGQTRIQDTAPDMGSVEVVPATTATPETTSPTTTTDSTTTSSSSSSSATSTPIGIISLLLLMLFRGRHARRT